jgi:hypothetical protein
MNNAFQQYHKMTGSIAVESWFTRMERFVGRDKCTEWSVIAEIKLWLLGIFSAWPSPAVRMLQLLLVRLGPAKEVGL